MLGGRPAAARPAPGAGRPVVLFLDEINRIPRQHANLLLGLMNLKRAKSAVRRACDARRGPFYVIEVPMTSEVVCLPERPTCGIVAAGNFGRAYAVYDLDPAGAPPIRYPDRVRLPDLRPGAGPAAPRDWIGGRLVEALVKVAHETRRLQENGERKRLRRLSRLHRPARMDDLYPRSTGAQVPAQPGGVGRPGDGAGPPDLGVAASCLPWSCGGIYPAAAIQDYERSKASPVRLGMLPEGAAEPILAEAHHG